jgi:hypothetical protein
MSNPETAPKYCFDTSAFIDSWRRYYRPDSFSLMWAEIDEMIASGLIVVPNEVKKEIGSGKDDLVLWFKKHHADVVHVSTEQISTVSDIVNKYPLISHYKKIKPYHADPFVIAVAKELSCSVVSFEVKNKSQDHPRIPDLCAEHGVEHLTMPDFFKKLGWDFTIS